MERPAFANRKEQLIWYIRYIIFPFVNGILLKIGESEVSEDIFSKIPDVVLIGHIMEVKDRYGSDLDKIAVQLRNKDLDMKTLDLSVVIRITVSYSHNITVQGLTDKAQKLTDLLISDKNTCVELFNKWKILNKLIS